MSVELRHLRYFLDLAQTEHLTQSARKLHITQSTLSHGLRQLESTLGIALFERIGRGIRLSQAGKAFHGYAARAIQEVESGRMALSELSGLNAGSLRIGTIPSFGYTLLPAALARFSARYPNVFVSVLELRAEAIEQRLADGELDVGISLTPAASNDLDVDVLFDEALVLVTRTDPPVSAALASRRTMRLRDLASTPLVMQPQRFVTRQILDAAFRQARVTPIIRLEMDSVESQIRVCKQGGPAAIIPRKAALLAEGLRLITLREPAPSRQAAVLWRRGGARNVAALEFVALLAEPARRR